MGCGIAGFVGASDRNLLRSMCEVISHRGPDSTGYYTDDKVGLGVDRLKVIDLQTGDQPIHNEDSSIWIVYNGEVYNYKELTTELEARGHRFYTLTDSEAVVHAYEEWGDDFITHLRGMYAFAIWDLKRKRLFLARDRFGKKPLFYAASGDVFLFGSEIKSILQYEELDRELDYDAVDYFFTYMYIPSPMTVFKHVRKLPPGSYATYEKGVLTVKKYWDFAPNPDESLMEDDLVDPLYDVISEAVRLRLRSDVPLGAFLSGGIDSSTVVSIMSRLSENPVKTVSIGFEGIDDELVYSRQVAELLGTDHEEHIVTPDAYKILPRLVWHFDEPFADHSLIPTYYLSQVTRKKVTVALSGDGGDELFMGYPFLLDPSSYTMYNRIPRVIRRPTLGLLSKFPVDAQFKRMANHAYEKDYGSQSFEQRYAMRMSIYDPAGLKRLYSEEHLAKHAVSDTYGYTAQLVAQCPSKNPLDALDYATVRSYLQEEILTKVDRMSMAVSLETRCPLLDQEVTALVERIPARLKMKGRTTKYIFKKMAISKGLIPRNIAMRSKQGFGAPIEVWMKDSWRDLVGQLLDSDSLRRRTKLFDTTHLQQLVKEPYTHSNRLFALVTFLMWHKLYVEETAPRGFPQSLVVS